MMVFQVSLGEGAQALMSICFVEGGHLCRPQATFDILILGRMEKKMETTMLFIIGLYEGLYCTVQSSPGHYLKRPHRKGQHHTRTPRVPLEWIHYGV